jgi:hypothetical protein
MIVPGRGLEPLRISPPDPKSGASANFATLANTLIHDIYIETLVHAKPNPLSLLDERQMSQTKQLTTL